MDKDQTGPANIRPEQRQVFVIRIWSEPREVDGEPPLLRGVIEHVTTGKKKYFLDLDDLKGFIIPFLKQMGF